MRRTVSAGTTALRTYHIGSRSAARALTGVPFSGGRAALSTARTTQNKFVIPEDGILLYQSNRKGEFRIQAGVALISCLAYGSYAWLQYDAKKQTGEFASSSATFTKIALGLGAVCVLTTPVFTVYERSHKCNDANGVITNSNSSLSTRRAVRRLWAIPTSPNTNVASALRIETYNPIGGAGKTVDLHLSEIVPVGKFNPTDRLIRFQVNGKRFFYVLSRDRGEFTNEQAAQRMLNSNPIRFSA